MLVDIRIYYINLKSLNQKNKNHYVYIATYAFKAFSLLSHLIFYNEIETASIIYPIFIKKKSPEIL
jgi:hypothetical protein